MSGELHFPHSLGLLYSAFTYFCGFKVNGDDYKLMGLAPFDEPKYVDEILEHLVDLKEYGSFQMDMSYFNYCEGLMMISRKFDRPFGGAPRLLEGPITQREMDMAASVQEVTEEIVLRMARHIKDQKGMANLCMAGGVALNCVSNGRLLHEKVIDDVWIQPVAGDAGGALGRTQLSMAPVARPRSCRAQQRYSERLATWSCIRRRRHWRSPASGWCSIR